MKLISNIYYLLLCTLIITLYIFYLFVGFNIFNLLTIISIDHLLVQGLFNLLILPASILFALGYAAIFFIFYLIFFFLSVIYNIFFDGAGITISFILFLKNIWEIINVGQHNLFFLDLFIQKTVVAKIIYIILGFLYTIAIYGMFLGIYNNLKEKFNINKSCKKK